MNGTYKENRMNSQRPAARRQTVNMRNVYVASFFAAAALLLVLSMFLFFNVSEIKIEGVTLYEQDRSSDSRELISGTWTDKDANITFEFSDEGDFTITHTDNSSVIAKGWFKIQEDGGSGKIQLLVNPSDRDTTVDIGLRMKFFSTISYKNLSVPSEDESDKVATCKFIFQNSDGVYSCERKDSDGSFYDGK